MLKYRIENSSQNVFRPIRSSCLKIVLGEIDALHTAVTLFPQYYDSILDLEAYLFLA
jgi:hypothetical protein